MYNNKYNFLYLLRRDLLSLKNDYFTLSLYTIVPVFCALFIYGIFSDIFPRNLPIAVIDNDETTTSRELIFNINSTPNIEIVGSFPSLLSVKDDIASAKIYGVLVVPKGLQKNAKENIPTKIPFYYNTQYVLVGENLKNSYLQATGYTNVKVSLVPYLIKSANLDEAKIETMPIQNQITSLYNSNSSYAQYLLTAILPCILQVVFAICLSNSLDRAFKEKVVRLQNAAFVIFATLFNNIIIFMFYYSLMMNFFAYLGFRVNGDIRLLYAAFLLFLFAIGSVIVFLKCTFIENARTMSFIGAYTAPSFAFSGITYPTDNMQWLGSFWSDILPIKYYLQVYVQQANYGANADSWPNIVHMLPFLLFLPAAVLVLRRKACHL